MGNPAECEVCRAIVREFLDACAEVGASPKLKDGVRTAYQLMLGMVGGTEEDVARAEEVLSPYRFRAQLPGSLGPEPDFRYPRIRDVVHKMWEHRLRTGHMPLFHK